MNFKKKQWMNLLFSLASSVGLGGPTLYAGNRDKLELEQVLATPAHALEVLIDQAEELIALKKENKITPQQGKMQSEQLYMAIENLLKLSHLEANLISHADYILLELSVLFALQTPTPDIQEYLAKALTYLSSLWSTSTGLPSLSVDALMKAAQAGQEQALRQYDYIIQAFLSVFTFYYITSLLTHIFHLDRESLNNLIKTAYMKAYNLKEPSPELYSIAQEALTKSTISRPVIILEDPRPKAPYTAYVQEFPTVAFMVITSLLKESRRQARIKTFAAYHEAGHLHYHHKANRGLFAAFTSSTLIGLSLFLVKHLHITNTKELLGGMLIMSVLAALLFKYGLPSYSRSHEKEADLFACERLIKAGRIDAIMEIINHPLGTLEPTSSLSATHYSGLEQANYLIECLQSKGVNVKAAYYSFWKERKREQWEQEKRSPLEQLSELYKDIIYFLKEVQENPTDILSEREALYSYNFLRELIGLAPARSPDEMDIKWLQSQPYKALSLAH
jgi:Zn-dependent protease with chaperone function